jgi:hypothetical protein
MAVPRSIDAGQTETDLTEFVRAPSRSSDVGSTGHGQDVESFARQSAAWRSGHHAGVEWVGRDEQTRGFKTAAAAGSDRARSAEADAESGRSDFRAAV